MICKPCFIRLSQRTVIQWHLLSRVLTNKSTVRNHICEPFTVTCKWIFMADIFVCILWIKLVRQWNRMSHFMADMRSEQLCMLPDIDSTTIKSNSLQKHRISNLSLWVFLVLIQQYLRWLCGFVGVLLAWDAPWDDFSFGCCPNQTWVSNGWLQTFYG